MTEFYAVTRAFVHLGGLTKEFLTTRERHRYLGLFIMHGNTTHSEACNFRFSEERSRKCKLRNTSIQNSAPSLVSCNKNKLSICLLPPSSPLLANIGNCLPATEKEERELKEAAIKVLLAGKRMRGGGRSRLTNFFANSNPESKRLKQLCKGPVPTSFISKY
jgi:hypothetical protein